MIFTIRQTISHPKMKNQLTQEVKIVGRDLPHAVEMVRCTAPERRDLLKKNWTRYTDPEGRTRYIEIISEGV